MVQTHLLVVIEGLDENLVRFHVHWLVADLFVRKLLRVDYLGGLVVQVEFLVLLLFLQGDGKVLGI